MSSPSDFDRTFDAAHVNAILNHPEVHPYISLPGQGALDAAPILADKRNICLAGEHGCFIFEQHEPGVYEGHTNFLPAGRGAYAAKALAWALRYLFTRTDCMEVLTKVPQANRGAEHLAHAFGFTLEFTLGEWQYPSGPTPVDHYALRYPQWVAGDESLIESGQWFHSRLTAAGAAPDHDDDETHDRHVGAAVQMILSGAPAKGVMLYNRWARFAGYAPIGVLSPNPLIIDIVDAWIHVLDNDIEVLKCQQEQ